jgi:aminopeptidase N
VTAATVTGVDDYLPGHGDPTYDVRHYDLALEYKVVGNHLSARATLTAVALQDVHRISLDLHRLHVGRVVVDGARARYRHRAGKLVVYSAEPLTRGQEFTVAVTYQGNPTTVPGIDGEAGWEELDDGVLVAGQPHGAPSWFPCNDRPSNKAGYRIEVATATAYHVTANGTLVEQRRGASRTTWVFDQPEPMATYLATVQIGRYGSRMLATAPVPIQAVRSGALARRADAALARQAEMMAVFTRRFGPYPFSQYTVVVTDDELEIPLEAQGIATFGANYATTDWQSERLVAHELAHQWFGNSLTVRFWRDIWLHEGFACYAEWLWSEESGGPSAAEHAQLHWRRLARLSQELILADPTPQLMFDDRVYKRGALALHTLRLTLGEQPFFEMLRSWVDDNAYGTVTTGMFLAHVQHYSGRPLGRLLDPWLFAAPLPVLPAS